MKGVGYPLVPEHVETRSLWSSRIPGIAQVSMGKFSSLLNDPNILHNLDMFRYLGSKNLLQPFMNFKLLHNPSNEIVSNFNE